MPRWTIYSVSSRQERFSSCNATKRKHLYYAKYEWHEGQQKRPSLHVVIDHAGTVQRCSLMCGVVLQDKLQRTQVLECIVLCTESYLWRNAKHGSETAADRWLAKTTKPIMANLRKGNFQFQEQQVRCWQRVPECMTIKAQHTWRPHHVPCNCLASSTAMDMHD